jgi:hypothetical protein
MVLVVGDGIVTGPDEVGIVGAGPVGVASPLHVPGVNVESFTTSFKAKYWNGPSRPIF